MHNARLRLIQNMKNTSKVRLLTIVVAAMVLTASCRTQRDLAYFEDLSTSEAGKLQAARSELTLQKDDEISITVSSEVPAATAHFNLTAADVGSSASAPSTQMTTTRQLQTYIVDAAGNIDFPTFGSIHVAGMTTAQLKDYLQERISKTVKNPVVKVRLMNFRVNVIGEVKKPQVVTPQSERLTLLEALAACEDLTEYGRRDNVIVMRETPDGEILYGKVNLHDSNLTSSPYYYMQQNDVVYVSPNNIRQDNSKYNQNNGYKLSVISTVISGLSVIASLVIALTVK